jgi:hypothetical protein
MTYSWDSKNPSWFGSPIGQQKDPSKGKKKDFSTGEQQDFFPKVQNYRVS